MSVRCARRTDLPAVIACKHSCGGNTTKDVSSLFYPLFQQPCATSRRVNISAHQTRRTPGRWLSSRADVDGGRNFLAFYTDVHGCTRGGLPCRVVKIPATDVPSQRRRSVPPRTLAMCNEECHVTKRNAQKFRNNTRKAFSPASYLNAHNAKHWEALINLFNGHVYLLFFFIYLFISHRNRFYHTSFRGWNFNVTLSVLSKSINGAE